MLMLNVSKEASNQSLIKLISKSIDGISLPLLYKLFRKKEIKVNGRWQKPDYIVKENDEVKIFCKDITFVEYKKNYEVENYNLDIIFENDDVLIINKPAGILSQKDASLSIDINTLICSKINSKLGFTPSITNRLDRNTSGLITVGKTYMGLNELSRAFRQKEVEKFYITIVEGKILKKIHEKAKLSRKNLKSSISDVGSDIETIIIPLKVFDNFTLCSVQILTGKTHQIRAQLSSLGHPIVGDKKYNAKNSYYNIKLKYHLLHCEKMKFYSSVGCNLGGMQIIAKRPKVFDKFIKSIENKV